MFTEVNEQALQVLFRHPELRDEAQRIVRKSNKELSHFIAQLKSSTWDGPQAEKQLQTLCKASEKSSMKLMERLQAVRTSSAKNQPSEFRES